jgi:hypothetical protein
VIADVEAGIWHDYTANQLRDRGLAVERMRPMDYQASFKSRLAGLFGIQCRHELTYRRWHAAAAAGDNARAGRGWVDVHAASHLEWLQECTQMYLISSFGDEVQGVFTLHDGLAMNLYPVLPDARPAQVIEERGTLIWILSRASLGWMLMPHQEQSHCVLLGRW